MPNDVVYDILADFKYVVPFGYAAEQFISFIKNDVHSRMDQALADA